MSVGEHNKLENRSTGALTELGEELKRHTIPGVDWRKKKKKIMQSNDELCRSIRIYLLYLIGAYDKRDVAKELGVDLDEIASKDCSERDPPT